MCLFAVEIRSSFIIKISRSWSIFNRLGVFIIHLLSQYSKLKMITQSTFGQNCSFNSLLFPSKYKFWFTVSISQLLFYSKWCFCSRLGIVLKVPPPFICFLKPVSISHNSPYKSK